MNIELFIFQKYCLDHKESWALKNLGIQSRPWSLQWPCMDAEILQCSAFFVVQTVFLKDKKLNIHYRGHVLWFTGAFSIHCCLVSKSCPFATPWTAAHQAPLSMGFSRQEYWSGLPFPSPGDLPYPGIKLMSPALASRFFTTQSPQYPLSSLVSTTVHYSFITRTKWQWWCLWFILCL